MNKPTLIVLGGFAGAGKTTVSARIAPLYNLPVFSTDAQNDVLRAALGKTFREVSPMAYEITWKLVRAQLNNGVSVILDTHMCTEKVWQDLDALRREFHSVNVLPIILQCSLDTHKARIDARGKTNKQHLNLGGEQLVDVLYKYEFVEKLKRPDLIRIDANGTSEEVFDSVNRIISQQVRAAK